MRPSPLNLFLIRHGEVEKRYQRVFGGRINMGLSSNGKRQAARLAHYLGPVHLDAIYASPMRRVQETLEPLLALNGHQPQLREALREVDFGAWTGMGWEQVKEKFKVSAFDWLNLLHQGGIPEAETMGAFRSRVGPVLREIQDRHAGQSVAVVCHGGVIRMALSILTGVPLPQMTHFDISYASLTLVECLPPQVEVQLLNFTPWRDLR